MTDLELWLIILSGMAVTYSARLAFIAIVPPERMPPALTRGLTYIPPAVLAAILVPELVLTGDTVDISISNHRLVAGMIAALVAGRFRNTWLTIGSGLLALWLLTTV